MILTFINPATLALLIVFVFALLVQSAYYLFIFSRLAFYKKNREKINPQETPPVSIIICAKNEAKNLHKYLRAILEQAYSEYQVIVVNDCSWDDSKTLLEQFETQYQHLKVVTLYEQEKYQHGKKFALSIGIKAAKYDLLLLTDADCIPAGKNWLANMQNAFSTKTDIVLGYGAYEKKSGLLNKLIRIDAFFAAMHFLSFSLAGITYMGVGRNLAYRKELFFKNKGFAKHQHILSGDDDLFINEVATSSNTSVEIEPHSFTFSVAKSGFSDWFRQKRRHISTAKYYKPKHKFLLFFQSFSHLLFYACIAGLLFLQFEWRIIASIYGYRLLMQLFIMGRSMKKLKEMDLLWLLPFFDIFILLFYPVLTLSNLISKPKAWK